MARRTHREEERRQNVQQERTSNNRSHYENNSRMPAGRLRKEEGRGETERIRQSNDLYERQSI